MSDPAGVERVSLSAVSESTAHRLTDTEQLMLKRALLNF